MKTEQIVLSFIAVIFGILVAGVGFYFYQQTNGKSIGKEVSELAKNLLPSPTPASSVKLTITKPHHEEIISSKTLTISGSAPQNATIIISSGIEDQITTASETGNFSIATILEDGVNELVITAIDENGNETQQQLTVSYTTESF